MLLERGPWAFGTGVVEYVRRAVLRGGGGAGEELSLEQQALQGIVQRCERLTAIRDRLAAQLAQVSYCPSTEPKASRMKTWFSSSLAPIRKLHIVIWAVRPVRLWFWPAVLCGTF